ncbi:MAG TPA: phosphoenolpyruvate carboxykinase (ATP) [Thermoanaerobaculia bacterium]|jgi:phosphoenolpyruvate carboxykinase (ATP)|nr:phosphoenolpyruvate carboxykinase (ATP) [Thermoanaerobaculia bacterium]
MKNEGPAVSSFGVDKQGITGAGTVYWNLSPARLTELAVQRGEATLSAEGALVCVTGQHTGRSPNDKFVVKDPATDGDIWWGEVNRPFEKEKFEALLARAQEYLQGKDIFVFDGYAGADPRYRINVRVISDDAWRNLFARNMFIREEDPAVLAGFEPNFTVINVANLQADPERDGTRTPTFILLDLAKRIALIGGTRYAGEIKKSIFSVMNYYLPKQGVLSMHCSANYGPSNGATKDDVALFFGLSGTGKTTLSADPSRTLIGDDEHGWSDDGVFNIEGGCYAKVIRLSPEGEPEIYATTRTFGTILENVDYDPETRKLDLDSDRLTENTRSSYPLTQLHNVDLGGQAGHPRNVVFLTCDAFGVLPPISRLTPEQAMYHFLSGYTAKVAGTERGVTEPKVTFSTCFGSPFLPLHPGVYAKMLGEKLAEHGVRVWLLNTGWTGGPYGVGQRIKLGFTRRMVTAALTGELDNVETWTDPIFGLDVPTRIEGVPEKLLHPRETWQSLTDYDAQATRLADMFADNFKKYESGVDEAVKAAGPSQVKA